MIGVCRLVDRNKMLKGGFSKLTRKKSWGIYAHTGHVCHTNSKQRKRRKKFAKSIEPE